MPDATYFWVLLLLLPLLVFVAAFLFARRFRGKNSDDWRARYIRARGLCIVWAILFLIMTVSAFERHDQSLLKKLFSASFFTLCFGIFFFQFLQARRKMREEPGFTQQKVKRPMPVFFWQALLILLPVALMAGFGFWAILRERNVVEQQAQQRAKEIFSSLPDGFGRIVANRLTDFEITKNGWDGYLYSGASAWPENKVRKQWLADTNNLQSLTNRMATMRSVFPEWPAGSVPLVSFSLNTNGDLSFASQTPPCPPAWLATMSAEQHQAWAALQTAAYASRSLSNLVKAFQQTQPPPPALACAEFMQLRAESLSLSATNAINQLLRFSGRHYKDISESGVPLKTLALAEALKRARDCDPTERLWEALQSEVSSPSTLTLILLDEAGHLVANDAQLTEAVKAMRILLADRLAQSEMAEAVKQTGKLNGITTTNLWMDTMGQRWFCVLSPSESQLHTSVSNRPVSIVSAITRVQCYPESIVARGFAGALTDCKVSLPKYFSISLELEGERVPLPSPWSSLGNGKP